MTCSEASVVCPSGDVDVIGVVRGSLTQPTVSQVPTFNVMACAFLRAKFDLSFTRKRSTFTTVSCEGDDMGVGQN